MRLLVHTDLEHNKSNNASKQFQNLMIIRRYFFNIAFALSASFLASCSDGTPKQASAAQVTIAVAQPSPEAQLSSVAASLANLVRHDLARLSQETPDNAIKSWWDLFDSRNKLEQLSCQMGEKADNSWRQGTFLKALTPEASARFEYSARCLLNSYRRTIDEVKSESETRAVVYTTVWQNIAFPKSAEKDAIEEAKRGTKFRYVLEKMEGKWLLSDVYRYSPKTSYSAEKWDRVYDGISAEYFSGTVYFQ